MKFLKLYLPWLGVAIVIVVLIWLAINYVPLDPTKKEVVIQQEEIIHFEEEIKQEEKEDSTSKEKPAEESAAKEKTKPVEAAETDESYNELERVLGHHEAKITIEEYASMSCGHCANFHNETLPKIKKAYIDTGKAKLIFKDFPLDRTAMFGSMVSQCMDEKQFFPVINRLFQKQTEWVQSENILNAIYIVLKPLGIEEQTILSCLENNEKNQKRWKILLEGRKVAMEEKNIEATPTFFVNGKKIEGKFNLSSLEEILK